MLIKSLLTAKYFIEVWKEVKRQRLHGPLIEKKNKPLGIFNKICRQCNGRRQSRVTCIFLRGASELEVIILDWHPKEEN